jgi:hypothetical protein
VLRIHAKDGHVIRERRAEGVAIYGRLVVGPASYPRIVVCVSSGRAPPEYCGNHPSGISSPGYDSRRHEIHGRHCHGLFGDTIVVWDWEDDTLDLVDLAVHGRPVRSPAAPLGRTLINS